MAVVSQQLSGNRRCFVLVLSNDWRETKTRPWFLFSRTDKGKAQCVTSRKNKVGSLTKAEQKTVSKLLKKARQGNKADGRFDIQLAEGEIAEEELRQLFTGGVTIEVKRDFMVSDTGNVAIEEAYRGKPSGIETTEADVWAIVLDGPEYQGEVKILISTKRLRCLVKEVKKYVRGGDIKRSKMRLVPVEWLIKKSSDLTCEPNKGNKSERDSRNQKTRKQTSPGAKLIKSNRAVRSQAKTKRNDGGTVSRARSKRKAAPGL
jgi:hypothetical protein